MGNFFSACNIAHPSSLPVFDKGASKAVHIAVNVDFLDGNFSRRGGFSSVAAMSDAHSLHATDSTLYLARASKLYRVTGLTPYAETEIATLTSNEALSFARFNGASYLSNGVDALVLNETTHASKSWIVATPNAPSLAATGGSLTAGRYRIGVSQRDSVTGLRSPMSSEAEIVLNAPGGVTVTLPALASGMTHTEVFSTDANGGTLYLQASTTSGSYVLSGFVDTGRKAPLHRQKSLPSGKYLAVFKGRLLSANGINLCVSDSYYPTMSDALKGFVPFPEIITAVVPVESGVWVATSNGQYFLEGTDPSKWVLRKIKDIGALAGSAFFSAKTKQQGWFDADGVRMLGESGESSSPQERVFAPRSADRATCFYDRKTDNIVVMLQGSESVSEREHPTYAEFMAL